MRGTRRQLIGMMAPAAAMLATPMLNTPMLNTPMLEKQGKNKVTKYVRYRHGSHTAYGIVDGDTVRELHGHIALR